MATSKSRQAGKAIVLAAREYMESKLDEPLRISDVAKHACTTVRTLERAFMLEYQMPPVAYLRVRRLAAARRLLRRANPKTSVRSIAASCGFRHFGRFSLAFRQQFGSPPSEFRARTSAMATFLIT